jgi:hypothetical protein
MRYTDKKKRLWLTTFGLLLLLHLSWFTAYRVSKNADSWSDVISDASTDANPHGQRFSRQESSSHSNSRPGRVIYPNSVIRGGVHSPEEFKATLLKDSIVAAHFSDFNASQSRMVDVKVDKVAYVSYRINDKVYWTKKKVKLARGEKLITDGKNYARARCGNRISEVSQAPTAADEPTHAFLDTPIPADDKDPLLLAAMPKLVGPSPDKNYPPAFGLLQGSRSHPPGFLIPGIIGGGAVAGRVFGPGRDSDFPLPPVVASEPGPLPTADVPEPGTLLFLASGLGCAIAFRKRLSK